MLKRIAIAVGVLAILTLGAGLLAGIGFPAPVGRATNLTVRPATRAPTHSRATTSGLHTSRAVSQAIAQPTSTNANATQTSVRVRPQARTTNVVVGRVSPVRTATTPLSDTTRIPPTPLVVDLLASPAITGTTPLSATTPPTPTPQVVDPASVPLPQPGPLLLLNPNTAGAGATLNVLGSGFDAKRLITLTLLPAAGGKAIPLDTAQAGSDGTFSKNVVLPDTLSGATFSVLATERKGTASAQAIGTLAHGSPVASLSTAVGKPGDTIYGSARGFNPHELVDVFINNLGTPPVVSLPADGGGTLSLAPIPVPYGPAGPTALLLLGRQSHGLAAVPFEMLNLYPNASVSSYAAVADTVLHFSASGFGPNEYVDVHINVPDSVLVGRMRSDSIGNLRNGGSFRIPFTLKGRNTFVLTGEQSHTSVTIAFTVQPYQPIAAPSTYDASPGTAFTFYGSGFARTEPVQVLLNGQQVALMRTDTLGNLIAKPGLYLIGPQTRPGKLHFLLVGAKSVTPVPVTVNVAPAAGPVQLGAPTATAGGQ